MDKLEVKSIVLTAVKEGIMKTVRGKSQNNMATTFYYFLFNDVVKKEDSNGK